MGNLLNKEWSPQINVPSDDESLGSTTGLIAKEKNSPKANAFLANTNTPINSKVVVADFDPRSPTNGIVRTPICYVNDSDSKKNLSSTITNSNPPKFSISDPRSPTNEYNRTPIHINTVNFNKNDLEQPTSDYLNDSSSSSSSSLDGTNESSILLQQVPDNVSNIDKQAINSNNSQNDSPGQYGLKLASSNMPRHILQRKQVEKLNKKKLIDYQDKENN